MNVCYYTLNLKFYLKFTNAIRSFNNSQMDKYDIWWILSVLKTHLSTIYEMSQHFKQNRLKTHVNFRR